MVLRRRAERRRSIQTSPYPRAARREAPLKGSDAKRRNVPMRDFLRGNLISAPYREVTNHEAKRTGEFAQRGCPRIVLVSRKADWRFAQRSCLRICFCQSQSGLAIPRSEAALACRSCQSQWGLAKMRRILWHFGLTTFARVRCQRRNLGDSLQGDLKPRDWLLSSTAGAGSEIGHGRGEPDGRAKCYSSPKNRNTSSEKPGKCSCPKSG